TALFDHFLALDRVIDDVPVFVRQIVFLEHGAHAVAPATRRFQISNDFRFVHRFQKSAHKLPYHPSLAILSFRLPFAAGRRLIASMPLKVLIVPDKFKGTLTARAAADLIARGWGEARPQDSLELLPMSDGGDGFGEVLVRLLKLQERTIATLDAAHAPLQAKWWWDPKTRTAIIESAKIIGLALLPTKKFHPFDLDTFGLGAVLQAAADINARQCLMGIGGSATNDGGL